jgi:hypothetical protein
LELRVVRDLRDCPCTSGRDLKEGAQGSRICAAAGRAAAVSNRMHSNNRNNVPGISFFMVRLLSKSYGFQFVKTKELMRIFPDQFRVKSTEKQKKIK